MSIAAGNDGESGVFAPSGPAAGRDAMAVASVDAGALVGWQVPTSQNTTFVESSIELTEVIDILFHKSYPPCRLFATFYYC